MRRAGVRNPISEVVLMLGSATLAAAAVGLLLRGPWAALLLAVAVPLVTRVVLEYLIRRRRQAFGDQLEETLQMLGNVNLTWPHRDGLNWPHRFGGCGRVGSWWCRFR